MVHILSTADKEGDNSATHFFSHKGLESEIESEEIQESQEKQ